MLLCKRHHTFVHEGGFRVEAWPDGEFRFLRPDGSELEVAPALRVVNGDTGAALRQRWVPPEVSITRDTGYPEWDGEPLDHDWVLGCLLRAKGKAGAPRRQRSRPSPSPGTAPPGICTRLARLAPGGSDGCTVP